MKWSISYPFDQWYVSNALENNKQLYTAPTGLGNVYVLATAKCFVAVLDNAAGPGVGATNGPLRIYPIDVDANLNAGYTTISWHGGAQMQRGIYMAAYSTLALAIAGGAPDAGNILWIEAYWRRGLIPNPA